MVIHFINIENIKNILDNVLISLLNKININIIRDLERQYF